MPWPFQSHPTPFSLLYSAWATSLAWNALPLELCMAHSFQAFSSLFNYFLFLETFSDHLAYSLSISSPCFIFSQSIITVRNYMIYFRVYEFVVYLPHLAHVNSWEQEPRLLVSSPKSPWYWMNQTNELSLFIFVGKYIYIYINYPNSFYSTVLYKT